MSNQSFSSEEGWFCILPKLLSAHDTFAPEGSIRATGSLGRTANKPILASVLDAGRKYWGMACFQPLPAGSTFRAQRQVGEREMCRDAPDFLQCDNGMTGDVCQEKRSGTGISLRDETAEQAGGGGEQENSAAQKHRNSR